jgi:hypothetical protein
VVNPVSAFPVDNNGVVISLPAVAPPGAKSLSGTVTFGIGTQPNNSLGGAAVYASGSSGELTTVYKGVPMSSFLDTGSNGYFFPDSTIPICSDFYCPASTLSLQASIQGTNGATTTVGIILESITAVSTSITAADVGGASALPRTFDWGLPFFFGRTVYVAFSGRQTPAGSGPYWAF